MIFKRLKKSTPEQEEEFKERMSDEQLTLKDKFAMTVSAFFMLVLPSILVLGTLVFIMFWIFGLL